LGGGGGCGELDGIGGTYLWDADANISISSTANDILVQSEGKHVDQSSGQTRQVANLASVAILPLRLYPRTPKQTRKKLKKDIICCGRRHAKWRNNSKFIDCSLSKIYRSGDHLEREQGGKLLLLWMMNKPWFPVISISLGC